MDAPLPSREIAGRRRYWLLDLRIAGRDLRVATAPVQVTTRAGRVLHYEGGLDDVSIGQERDAEGGQESQRVTVRLVHPLDWGLLRRAGHDLSAGRGTLSEWATGLLWEQRRRVLTGAVVEPGHGRAGQEIEFSLSADPGPDPALLPGPLQVIDPSTWPSAIDESIGKPYPIPLGAPGEYLQADGTKLTTSGSRAYVVDTALLLIAVGRVEAVQVWVFDGTGVGESFAVQHQYDGRGQLCAVVDISGASTISTTDTEYWIGWRRASGWGGGLLGRHGRAMHGAGEIARWLLSRSGQRVNLAQVDVAASLLDRWVIGAAIGSVTSPREYLESEILPHIPACLDTGPDGLELHLLRWGRPIATMGPHLGLVRVGDPQDERPAQEVLSELRIAYAIRQKTQAPRRYVVLTPRAAQVGEDAVETWRALESYRAYTQRAQVAARRPEPPADEVEVRTIYDRGTAMRRARMQLERDSHVPTLVSYWDPHRLYDHVRVGHTVLVQDDGAGLSGRGLVDRIEETRQCRTLRVRLRAPMLPAVY